MNHSTIISLFLLFSLGLIWGSGYSLAKFAMSNGVPPLGYAYWQSLGPALCLSVCCYLQMAWKRDSSSKAVTLNQHHFIFFLVTGLTGIVIPNTNMYFIATHLPAGLLAVLVNTVPLIIYPLAIVCKIEKPDHFRLLAILVGMTGIMMILNPSTYHLSPSWGILALISPFSFAVCSIYIAKYQRSPLNHLQAATGMLIASSLLLSPMVIQQHAFYPLNNPFELTQQVIFLEMILSSLGYVLFFFLIEMAGPVYYSLTGGMVALTGMLWGFLLFAETPSIQQFFAIIMIVSSIFLMSWRQSKQMREYGHAE